MHAGFPCFLESTGIFLPELQALKVLENKAVLEFDAIGIYLPYKNVRRL